MRLVGGTKYLFLILEGNTYIWLGNELKQLH